MKAFDAERSLVTKLARTPQMGEAMVAYAKVGQNWARANAPRHTGEYAAAFEVRATDLRVAGQTRRGAVLVNHAPHAAAVEWVNGAHVLARAVDVIERGR